MTHSWVEARDRHLSSPQVDSEMLRLQEAPREGFSLSQSSMAVASTSIMYSDIAKLSTISNVFGG